MSTYDNYYHAVRQQLDQVYSTQRQQILQAAHWVAEALRCDGWLYVFGTGHSHILAEEVFFRAGGLFRAIPILDETLMLHRSATAATECERTEGHARKLLAEYALTARDVLIVASNSGRNNVPIELALEAATRGVKVVVIGSSRHARQWPSRHHSGRLLSEVGHLNIDNGAVSGDAVLTLDGLPGPVGPTSTIRGAYIVNSIVVAAIEDLLGSGASPEIYVSNNSDGDTHNRALIEKYRRHIKHL